MNSFTEPYAGSVETRHHPAEKEQDRQGGVEVYRCPRCHEPTVISLSYAEALRSARMFPGMCNVCWAPIAKRDLAEAKDLLRRDTIRVKGQAVRRRLGLPVRSRYMEIEEIDSESEYEPEEIRRQQVAKALRRHEAKINATESAALRQCRRELVQTVGPERAAEMLYVAAEPNYEDPYFNLDDE